MSAGAIIAMNTAVAANAAHQARLSECRIKVDKYDPKTTTKEGMQEYASCVKTLYPEPIPDADMFGLKILFAICLVGFMFEYAQWFRRGDGPFESLVGGFFGFVGFGGVAIFGYLVFWLGIPWLFS